MATPTRSPFYVIQDFVSPYLCEEMIDLCDFNVPDVDKEGDAVKTLRFSETAENIVYERLILTLAELQAHYQFLYKGTERMTFEWYPEGSHGECVCGNSSFLRGKWLRMQERDFTGVLFLSDYQDKPQFEQEYEVYGGKLEFPQHQFGFNPQRGTLVLFPAVPHFINATARILAGDLFQVRFHIAAQSPWLYNPTLFPGDFRTWFKDLEQKQT